MKTLLYFLSLTIWQLLTLLTTLSLLKSSLWLSWSIFFSGSLDFTDHSWLVFVEESLTLKCWLSSRLCLLMCSRHVSDSPYSLWAISNISWGQLPMWYVIHSVMSSRPHGLQPARLLCPWNSPWKDTGGLPFPSGDLPDPGIGPRSPALREILYHLSHQGSPKWSLNLFLWCRPFSWAPHPYTQLDLRHISSCSFHRHCKLIL